MNKISQIQVVYISNFHINNVYEHLQSMGSQGLEGVALWSGVYKSQTEFEIKATLIPKQISSRSEEGLQYQVGSEELERINLWLYENKQTLIAQIHSHPGRAYHSEIDDAFPIVARLGGISIVVPNFGFPGFSIEEWAIYRLSEKGWIDLKSEEVSNLIKIIL